MSKLRVGVAGPVGSGKTALVEALCRRLRQRLQLAVVTNDIYTRRMPVFPHRAGALGAERIRGVETGGAPHRQSGKTARSNRAAVEELEQQFPDLDLVLVESGGDNLAPASARTGGSLHLCDRCSRWRQNPAQGGPALPAPTCW